MCSNTSPTIVTMGLRSGQTRRQVQNGGTSAQGDHQNDESLWNGKWKARMNTTIAMSAFLTVRHSNKRLTLYCSLSLGWNLASHIWILKFMLVWPLFTSLVASFMTVLLYSMIFTVYHIFRHQDVKWPMCMATSTHPVGLVLLVVLLSIPIPMRCLSKVLLHSSMAQDCLIVCISH